ncbi:MAG TPA: FG-GAP-like repeat-containing protein [Bryobacteraceae bacterium]|nr:FG-GAP-like repeat-containing protein [Bryobacteraceae bacterium]
MRNIRRRHFLTRSCQGTAALLLRGGLLQGQNASAGARFHLHPQYRSEAPLDAARRNVQSGLDEFPEEKDHDRIASILAQWSAGLLESPRKVRAVERALAPGFEGTSLRSVEYRQIRAAPALEVRRIIFSAQRLLGRDAFLHELQSYLDGYAKILTAEFQVTRLHVSAGHIGTRVRYELTGSGPGFYREQRVGAWELDWEGVPSGEYRVLRWRASDETRSRAAAPWYADMAERAFGGNTSYSQQLLHGADYWRTVLDGACGIDVYGHNGVSAGDIDGDGFDDLYVCQPAGLPNRLYRNRGDGTFEDVTEVAGVGVLENTACALLADFDNDGRQDLLVVRANGPLLFLNQGGGKFRRQPGAFQFASAPQGTFTGAAAADYNRDGWLDIYLCLYSYYQGTDQYRYPVPYYAAENGPPNFMMRNNGDGTFRDVTRETGLNRNNTRYSFCCGWSDFNGDGWPDLYVVNDFGRKNLYRNNGDGTFTDVAAQAGVEDVGAGMSVSWLDYDNDGAPDLYVADMWTAAGERISAQEAFQKSAPETVRALYRKHAMGNSLFRNGGAAFADATGAARVRIGRWSWASDAWDFDQDGLPDLYIANGMLSGPISEDLNSYFWRQVVAKSPDDAHSSPDYEQGWNAINELIRADYTWSGFERNVCYANNGDGTFSDVSGAVGLDFIEDGRAFSLADFDHDGRQEVLLKNRNAPQLRLLKNIVETLPPAIAFRLRGIKSNRDAIGATVSVETGLGKQSRILQAGSGFLSQHSKEVFFGLGASRGPVKARILWPSGLVQEFRDLPINHRIWIDEGAPPVRVEPFLTGSPVRAAGTQPSESLPETVETWLLSPVAAPAIPPAAIRGRPALVHFPAPGSADTLPARWTVPGVQLLSVDVNEAIDLAATYNILYRSLFDRHRDLALPAAFLIDEDGNVVKVYQGPVSRERVAEDAAHIPRTGAERLAKALPFRGAGETYDYGRNFLSLGSAFFQRGYYEQAETAFRAALRGDPASAEAQYGLGSVYLKQEKTREARDSFARTVKLTAGYPDTLPNAWNNLGLLAAREGHLDEAVGHFQEALRISPDYWIALENLGNAYRVQKRWSEARTTLEGALAARPDDPEANYNLAMVFAQTGDSGRGFEYLRKALQLRPGYPEALNNLGVLYLRTRRRDEAVAKFEECIRVAPAFDQAYLNLARVYSLEGTPEKARTVLLELLKRHPDHALARKTLDELR